MININGTGANASVLASLRRMDGEIARAQTRIGTGYRINVASDGLRDWTLGQSLRAGLRTQEAANDAMTVSKARADVALAGLDRIVDLLEKIEAVSTGLSPTATGATLASAQSAIRGYQTEINAAIQASRFQGRNILAGAGESVTTGLDASGAAIRLSVTGIDISAAAGDFGRALSSSMADAAAVRTIAGVVTMARAYVTDYRASLSAFSSSIDTQLDLQATLTSIREAALSRLVDADMDAEAAKVAAIEAKRQLAHQALGITNAAPRNVLALFA